MTNLSRIAFGPGFKDFEKFFIGYDDLFDRLNEIADAAHRNSSGYPPYNIYKVDETHSAIEIAVAGFSEEELDIELVENQLTVKGNKVPASVKEYSHQGLAARDFTRTFGLGEHVHVAGAELKNGLLTIALERIVPEHKLPKKIVIGSIPTIKAPQKELLTEKEVK